MRSRDRRGWCSTGLEIGTLGETVITGTRVEPCTAWLASVEAARRGPGRLITARRADGPIRAIATPIPRGVARGVQTAHCLPPGSQNKACQATQMASPRAPLPCDSHAASWRRTAARALRPPRPALLVVVHNGDGIKEDAGYCSLRKAARPGPPSALCREAVGGVQSPVRPRRGLGCQANRIGQVTK